MNFFLSTFPSFAQPQKVANNKNKNSVNSAHYTR